MGDSTYKVGQNVPAGSFGTYPARSSKAQGGAPTASFQSILNQQQSPHSVPNPTIAQSNAPISSALPPQFQEETMELMANMPHRVQPGENFQNKMLENQREYQAMKAVKSGPQPTTNPQITRSSTAALNSAFGQSFTPAPIESAPLPSQSNYSQPAQSQLEPVIDNSQSANPLLATPNRFMWSDDAVSSTTQSSQQQVSESGEKKGVGESFFGFFKNIASFATLGFYRPDNEAAPTGIARVGYPFKKLLWDAPKSLIVDTPVSIANSVSRNKSEAQAGKMQLTQTETSSRSSRRYASSKPWLHTRA